MAKQNWWLLYLPWAYHVCCQIGRAMSPDGHTLEKMSHQPMTILKPSVAASQIIQMCCGCQNLTWSHKTIEVASVSTKWSFWAHAVSTSLSGLILDFWPSSTRNLWHIARSPSDFPRPTIVTVPYGCHQKLQAWHKVDNLKNEQDNYNDNKTFHGQSEESLDHSHLNSHNFI